jgi:hypothetical protein
MTRVRDLLDIPGHVSKTAFTVTLTEGVSHAQETVVRRSGGAYLHRKFRSPARRSTCRGWNEACRSRRLLHRGPASEEGMPGYTEPDARSYASK